VKIEDSAGTGPESPVQSSSAEKTLPASSEKQADRGPERAAPGSPEKLEMRIVDRVPQQPSSTEEANNRRNIEVLLKKYKLFAEKHS
jgi:hypothetical protein